MPAAADIAGLGDAGPTGPSGVRRPGHALGLAAEACIALAVLVPPFLFGGREAIGQAVLAGLALAAGGLVLLRAMRDPTWALAWRRPEVWLPAAGLALGVLTWVPLPPGLVKALAPGIGRLLPGWDGGAHFGIWTTFSLAPGLSRDATLLWLPPALLFWAVLGAIRSPGAVDRLMRVFFLTGVGIAAVGFLHYLFGNGKFYGLWQLWWVPADGHFRAPFTNRNHLAGFLALTLGPGLAYLARQLHRWQPAHRGRRPTARPHDYTVLLTGAGLTLIVGCTLLSLSRGGTVAAVVALAAAAFGLFRARGLAVLLAAGLSGLVLLFAFGGSAPLERLTGVVAEDKPLDEVSTNRLRLWQADLHAVADFPVLGCGPGSHPYVYPLYLEKPPAVTYTHAENGYLQVLMEGGTAGAVLLAVAVGCVVWWSLRRPPASRRAESAAAAGVAASLLAALVHGFVDFVWYVPAYAAALAVLAALACRLSRVRRGHGPRHLPRPAGRQVGWTGKGALAVAWGVLVVVLGVHFVNRVHVEAAWDAYFHLVSRPGPAADPTRSLQEQVRCLADACRHRSGDPDHHYRLALAEEQLYLAQARGGREPLTLAELRLDLHQHGAATPAEAVALLRKRYRGDVALLARSRDHFRAALASCPLQGPAYLRLAETAFLDGPGPGDPAPYCTQALLVRPHDPAVWFEAGTETCRCAGLAAAGRYWSRACTLYPAYEWQLLPVLQVFLPPEEVVRLIPLDFEGLRWLARQKARSGGPAGKRFLAREARRVLDQDPAGSQNPDAWVALHELFRDAGLPDEAEACLRRALELAPGRPASHVRLVHWLAAVGKPAEASEQYRRARERFPDDPDVWALRAELWKPTAPPGVKATGGPP
jgi:O-antigen ligase/tetratricopeptide (TPR) repeat protein